MSASSRCGWSGPAAICSRFAAGANVVVRNSALAWSGLRAAVFEDVKGGGLEACAIADTGFGAVRLVAGDRPSLSPAASSSVIRD